MAPREVTFTLRARHVAVAIVGVVVLAAGTGALAGGTFTDVGPSHPFVDEIEAIAGAGITTGYEDGTYRPGATVTRGAMAAFMGRGFGRVAWDDDDSSTTDSNVGTNVAQATVTSGATEAGGGFVHVTADLAASTSSPSSCPCAVFLSLQDGVSTLGSTSGILHGNDPTALALGASLTNLSTSAVFAIPADTTRTYRVRASYLQANDPTVNYQATIVATYVPFAGDGGNQL